MDMASQCGRWATDGTAELRGNGMFVRRDRARSPLGGWNRPRLDRGPRPVDATRGRRRARRAGAEVDVGGGGGHAQLGELWHQRMRWAEGSLRRLIEHGPRLLAGAAAARPQARLPRVRRRVPDSAALRRHAWSPACATDPLPQPADWTRPCSPLRGLRPRVFLLALAGLSAMAPRAWRSSADRCAAPSSSRTGCWSCRPPSSGSRSGPAERHVPKTPRMDPMRRGSRATGAARPGRGRCSP